MSIVYGHPEGVSPENAGRPLLSTGQGGFVAVDAALLELWRVAAGRSLDELVQSTLPHPDLEAITPAALACLAEAGLLARTPAAPWPDPPLRSLIGSHTVSAVIVVSVAGELVWLEECVRALSAQHHALDTVLVLDNAVGIDMVRWLADRQLTAQVHTLPARTNFATALNAGCDAAPPSEHLFFLNADMRPHPCCVRNMVARALETPRCAAVAPKLYLWRAPAFLNGIGNRVPGWGWGTDNGIGQLDLGQLDDWTDVPSGCLGAMLISRRALLDVGRFDPRYPVYYEDTDWSYRARLQGYRIAAAPDAHALHAFGASWTGGEPAALSPAKLEHALIGQFRFSTKIAGRGRAVLLALHWLNDSAINIRGALRNRDRHTLSVYARAAARTAWSLPQMLLARRRIQARRVIRDAELFHRADDLTPSLTWRNLPELTCASVRDYYAPLMHAGRTRRVPELTAPGRRQTSGQTIAGAL